MWYVNAEEGVGGGREGSHFIALWDCARLDVISMLAYLRRFAVCWRFLFVVGQQRRSQKIARGAHCALALNG